MIRHLKFAFATLLIGASTAQAGFIVGNTATSTEHLGQYTGSIVVSAQNTPLGEAMERLANRLERR